MACSNEATSPESGFTRLFWWEMVSYYKPNQPFSVGQTLIPFVLNTKWTYKKIYHTKQQGKD